VHGSLLAVLVASVLLAALARRYDVSAPLALVVAGLAASTIPGFSDITLDPDLVLYVLLPPLLWSAGLESSYVGLKNNLRPIGLLAIGLPLATAFAVGFVAYKTVPDLTLAAGLTLGAIVAPPDAVSATAVGRRLGLPRQIMTLLGGESLLNDATALTAYKVALAAAIGAATSWGSGLATFALAAGGGVAIGLALGFLIAFVRWRLHDALVESAVGLVAPFVIYLTAEEAHGSGVLAVVVAALILGQKSFHAGYETRLQDQAVWKALQLVLESFAFLMIGLQLPTVIDEIRGMPFSTMAFYSLAVLATVIVVRIVWVYAFAFLPRMLSARIRAREVAPTGSQVFIVAWAGMRGVVSLAAAFAVPLTTLSGAPFPGREHIVFLTFVVVIGTLLLHGLTLPWLIRRLGVHGNEARTDAIAAAAAQEKAANAAADRLDELLATSAAPVLCHGDLHHGNVLRGGDGAVAVDPRGVWAEPAFDVAVAMLNPLGTLPRDRGELARLLERRLRLICPAMGVDADRGRAWTAVYAVISALWSAEDGLGIEEDSLAVATALS
jgi:monovalent cation/hydrogen antiporter